MESKLKKYHQVILLFIFICSLGHAKKIAPMQKVSIPQNITDDLAFEHLLTAISRQMNYFDKVSLEEKMQFADRVVTRNHLLQSLKEFRVLVVDAINCFQLLLPAACYEEFNNSLNHKFEAYRPVPKKRERGFRAGKTFFTAYYSPEFEGSFTKTQKFKYPIYGLPAESSLQNATSDQINYQGALDNKGLELFYVSKSLYDIWLLHVEGGGRIRVKVNDGFSYQTYYLSYAGTNKKSFKMLSKYMVAKGMLKKEDTSIEKQRKYFNEHPEKQREILAFCESYVFFKITKQEPLGVHNISLTPGRSLATDYRIYKEYGLINFVQTIRPIKRNNEVTMEKFSRFFLNQDTGGSIRGNARADLYFGYGDNAELAANYLHGTGNQFILILK